VQPNDSSILIIRPSALGDVCRSVPLAVSLRASFPSAHIAWVVQDSFVEAVVAHPAVDEVIAFPRNRWKRWWRPACLGEIRTWVAGLRGRFALVIDAQGLGRSGLIARATGAPRRVGFADAREGGWLGINERHRVSAVHTVDRMLGLLEAAGIPPVHDLRLHLRAEDRVWWDAERVARGIPARYAVFAPTSRWTTKDWPAERWRGLVAPMLERGVDAVLFLGTRGESDRVQASMPTEPSLASRVVNLAGATGVGQSMAVIAGAELVVANDSAPLHIAVGFDRRLIALFGPTDPALVGPYRREQSVLRAPAAASFRGSYRDRSLGDALMRLITVDDVIRAIEAGCAEPGALADCRLRGDA
jgi:heptosyltransferase I